MKTFAKNCLKAYRLARRYRNWYEYLKSETVSRLVLWNGTTIYSPPNYHEFPVLVKEIMFKKIYNPPGFEIGRDDIVMDIGANIGVFALYAAKQTRSRVFAFEPALENYEYLVQNCNVNNTQNLVCLNAAIASKVGEAKLFHSSDQVGYSLIDHNIHGKLEYYTSTPTTTLNVVMMQNNLDRIDFLKMDCEGAEGEILSTLEPEAFSRINKIAMEFHDNVSQLAHSDILNLLNSHAYSTECIRVEGSPFGYIYAKHK